MGILVGFAPWIVYWVLVGNAPFTTAVLVALAVAILGLVMSRTRKVAGLTFEIGSVAAFFVLTVLTFVASQAFLEQWVLPLSTAAILLITLVGALTGTPFVREFAAAGRSEEIVTSELFTKITSLLTWIWIAAFAGMTVSSAIPPIVSGDATILDTANPLSVLCYWVIPFALLMGYIYGRTDSYAIGLWLLSVTAAVTLVLTLTVVRRTEARLAEAATHP